MDKDYLYDKNPHANRSMEEEPADVNYASIANAVLAVAQELAQINKKLDEILKNGLPIETVSD